MIVLIQAALIIGLELGLQSWVWVAGVPLAFGMAAPVPAGKAAGRGAAAGGLAWLLASLAIYVSSGRIIAGRMTAMLGLGRSMGWLMILLTGLLGALVAGLAAYAGSGVRRALGAGMGLGARTAAGDGNDGKESG